MTPSARDAYETPSLIASCRPSVCLPVKTITNHARNAQTEATMFIAHATTNTGIA